MPDYNQCKRNIGNLVGAVLAGAGLVIVSYALINLEIKLHDKLFHPKNGPGWEVRYEWHNVYDDKCLDNMPGIEKFRSK